MTIKSLNEDIKKFPQVFPIEEDMHITQSGVGRMVWLDRYSFKDSRKATLKEGDLVVVTVKQDPKFPAQGIGTIQSIDRSRTKAQILIEEEWRAPLEGKEAETGLINRDFDLFEKPLEIFWEQAAKRIAKGLSEVEATEKLKEKYFNEFYRELKSLNFVPAGRVLYGAGSGTDVTYFNCYVMPFMKDSREGIHEHRKITTEIMSRGGGVGTNGSTLRPRNALAKGVNGRSSGSVSWLHDLSTLTNLVEQGGSRRGAQMIMLADWHPDIIEFILSKMQNPDILRRIIMETNEDFIKELAKNKLKFTPFSPEEKEVLELAYESAILTSPDTAKSISNQLKDGGRYSVHQPDFLTGANISVTITKDFMEALENNQEWELKFPDLDSYTQEEMELYDEQWQDIGDVREWEQLGFKVKTYRTIKAEELWKLINTCATFSAEPGIFFIDNANEMTNAKAYGQKVVATNPCGEQPLAPFSVCNLAAVNLAHMADKENKVVDFEKLKRTVATGVRMQDNVIDSTPYFLEENKKQALGERRIGLGVMGLHDLLLYCEVEYGSSESNKLVDKIFKVIAETAYTASIELSKEKGSFPFLLNEDGSMDEYKVEKFINSGYMKKMDSKIREDILKYGIRNSHLLTVAPTGSTGTFVGVSTGLEPYFGFKYFRSGRLGKFIEVNQPIVQEYFDKHPEAKELPHWFVTAMDLSPEAHVKTQCIIQNWVDSSISKTVNAPKGYTVDQVAKVYESLYKGGAKGGTVYVDGSRDAQVLSLTNDEEEKEVVEEVVLERLGHEKVKDEEKVFGSNVGDTCPSCRVGTVIDSGGCNTCNNCGTQLKCGL